MRPFYSNLATMPAMPSTARYHGAIRAFESLGARVTFGLARHLAEPDWEPDRRFQMVEATDEDLQRLPDLLLPFDLDLSFSKITDAGLDQLVKFRNLSSLNLGCTKVTDQGLK